MKTMVQPVLSRQHRRMVANSYHRQVALEFAAEKVLPSAPAPRLSYQEAVELILQYTDLRDTAVRQAMDAMASQLVTIYEYIDLVTATKAPTGSYARGQQVVLEQLIEKINAGLYDDYNPANYEEPPF